MSAAQEQTTVAHPVPSPHSSAAPLLAEGDGQGAASGATGTASSSKTGSKRRLFGFGKKKEGDKVEKQHEAGSKTPDMSSPPTGPTSTSHLASPQSPPLEGMQLGVSPHRNSRASTMASPGQRYRSSSPRMHSPASSLIFERNVQDNTLPGELSPAIPAHIQTEDHIPPVLEASSLAITDDHLNPDEVEIVMHSAHQPAAAAVSGSAQESTVTSPLPIPLADDFSLQQPDLEEPQSNYGSLDTTDPRRLSFISFADVVQAEHAEVNRDALHLMSLSTTTNRSPSPVRSPASSHGMSASPPTSGAASVKGMEAAPAKGSWPPGSPTTGAPGTHSPSLSSGGELQIETMRQALRKTGSGDLSGARSQPLSAVSMEDSGISDAPFR